MHHCTVEKWVSIKSVFSSLAQLKEQWSIIKLFAFSTRRQAALCSFPLASFSPTRKRICRIIKFSEPPKFISFFMIQTPSPGAVCPASVKFLALQRISDFNSILPETAKTTVVASFCEHCCNAHLKEPSPSSLVLVTITTFPPRPPVAFLPKPSAVGKAFNTSGPFA